MQISYYCSRLQSVAAASKVKHLNEANRVLQMAQTDATKGLLFKAGAFDWNTAVMTTITDASFANETKIVDDKVFPRRSQKGRLTVLAGPGIWHGDKEYFHVIGWKNTMICRVCRSTMKAET